VRTENAGNTDPSVNWFSRILNKISNEGTVNIQVKFIGDFFRNHNFIGNFLLFKVRKFPLYQKGFESFCIVIRSDTFQKYTAETLYCPNDATFGSDCLNMRNFGNRFEFRIK